MPLTVRWQDHYSNNAPGSPDGTKWPVFDSSIWVDPHSHAAVGPGGATASAQQLITATAPYVSGQGFEDSVFGGGSLFSSIKMSEGMLASLDHAVLNHQWGTLDLAQMVQVAGNSRYLKNKVVNRHPAYILTSTELGRFTGLGRRIRADNPRPGNASWQDEMFRGVNDAIGPGALMPADSYLAKLTSKSSEILIEEPGSGTESASLAGSKVAQIYSSKIAYPSGGFGAMWNNYHDSGFSVALSCAAQRTATLFPDPLFSTGGITSLPDEDGVSDSELYHNLWSLTFASWRRITSQGITPSGQQGWRTPNWNTAIPTSQREVFLIGRYSPAGSEGSKTGQPDYAPSLTNTLQIPAVYDQISTVASDTRAFDGTPGIFRSADPI